MQQRVLVSSGQVAPPALIRPLRNARSPSLHTIPAASSCSVCYCFTPSACTSGAAAKHTATWILSHSAGSGVETPSHQPTFRESRGSDSRQDTEQLLDGATGCSRRSKGGTALRRDVRRAAGVSVHNIARAGCDCLGYAARLGARLSYRSLVCWVTVCRIIIDVSHKAVWHSFGALASMEAH